MVTLAPEMTAPLLSVTVPVMPALACAKTRRGAIKIRQPSVRVKANLAHRHGLKGCARAGCVGKRNSLTVSPKWVVLRLQSRSGKLVALRSDFRPMNVPLWNRYHFWWYRFHRG